LINNLIKFLKLGEQFFPGVPNGEHF